VAADSKFVDLGADSLDTVSGPPRRRPASPCLEPPDSGRIGGSAASRGPALPRLTPPPPPARAAQVEIMMALEDKFDITLDEEGAEKISTVQEAADLIAAQIATK
jgi:acyl carrier protein